MFVIIMQIWHLEWKEKFTATTRPSCPRHFFLSFFFFNSICFLWLTSRISFQVNRFWLQFSSPSPAFNGTAFRKFSRDNIPQREAPAFKNQMAWKAHSSKCANWLNALECFITLFPRTALNARKRAMVPVISARKLDVNYCWATLV